jgi:uncharacterized NAD-dependent epimerase/dehydratase family protein
MPVRRSVSQPAGIPIFASLGEALARLDSPPDYFVIGLAPDGGRLPESARAAVREALDQRTPRRLGAPSVSWR